MTPPAPRDDVRERIVGAAAEILRTEGSAGVTTRAVAERAGVQAPTIYRLFGDKDGLLDAVAEHAMALFSASKTSALTSAPASTDPVGELREAWGETVRFGLDNADLYVILSDPRRGRDSPALANGVRALEERVRRVAAAGLLRVAEARAVALIHAAGTGAILSLLEQPIGERDPELATTLLDAVLDRILIEQEESAAEEMPAAHRAAAITLRAVTSDLTALSVPERALLAEWLGRIIDSH